MSATRKTSRLEIDVKKLQSIINDLVEENYYLKNLLSQPVQTSNQKDMKVSN